MLLNNGLKYNLYHKPKNWITNVALKAETAINSLDIRLRNHFRFLVAHNLQTLVDKKHKIQHSDQHRINKEKITLSNIKRKLMNNNNRITKADKGNSIVILYNTDYNKKINYFIDENHFSSIPSDPTSKL
jgi:hypothetical protein